LKGDCRTDAAAVIFRQSELEPLCHTVALNNEYFIFQGREGIFQDPLDGDPSQILHAVGMNDGKTGRQRRFFSVCRVWQRLSPKGLC